MQLGIAVFAHYRIGHICFSRKYGVISHGVSHGVFIVTHLNHNEKKHHNNRIFICYL